MGVPIVHSLNSLGLSCGGGLGHDGDWERGAHWVLFLSY